jgi:hypothetical protein
MRSLLKSNDFHHTTGLSMETEEDPPNMVMPTPPLAFST